MGGHDAGGGWEGLWGGRGVETLLLWEQRVCHVGGRGWPGGSTWGQEELREVGQGRRVPGLW